MTADCHFVLSALALEQWLRFAWLDEQERLAVPHEAQLAVATHFPDLVPLLNTLLALEKPVDGNAARAAILAAAEAQMSHSALVTVLDNPDFQAQLRRFFGWVQEEADTPRCDSRHFHLWWNAFLHASEQEKL